MNEENIHTPRGLVNLSPRRLTKNLKKNKNYYGQEIYLENGHSDLDQHSDGYWYDAGGNQLYDVKKTPASLGLAGGAGEFRYPKPYFIRIIGTCIKISDARYCYCQIFFCDLDTVERFNTILNLNIFVLFVLQ